MADEAWNKEDFLERAGARMADLESTNTVLRKERDALQARLIAIRQILEQVNERSHDCMTLPNTTWINDADEIHQEELDAITRLVHDLTKNCVVKITYCDPDCPYCKKGVHGHSDCDCHG